MQGRWNNLEKHNAAISLIITLIFLFLSAILLSLCALLSQSLFPSLTKVLRKELGPSVRSNWDYNFNWPLLTVVKIKTKKFGLFDSNGRYKPLRLKLTDLTKENLSLG